VDNLGASVGRNSGLDAAGFADYYLMIDGGIRNLVGGTEKMLRYLERTPSADLIGVEIPDFETDYDKAWRRWPEEIADNRTYVNVRLSHTAYCLARHKCFDGIRFCEEGPFSEGGWACEDDEMAYQWNDAGIAIHVVTGVHPYRRASGSFRRIFKETGIWPAQFGSVYEKRLVWLQQNWPQYQPGVQWGEPWLTVVVEVSETEDAIRLIKIAHDRLRERRLEDPFSHIPNPYSVVAWCADGHPFLDWAELRRLRQHHGDTIIVDGEIVSRDEENEDLWTGDFRVWNGDDWKDAIRPGAHYYGLVKDANDLEELLSRYGEACPPSSVLAGAPDTRKEL
jgi:hypothetical protein